MSPVHRFGVMVFVVCSVCTTVLCTLMPDVTVMAQRGQASVLFLNRTPGDRVRPSLPMGNVVNAPLKLFADCPVTIDLPKGEKFYSMDAPIVTEVSRDGAGRRTMNGYDFRMRRLRCVREN